MNNIIKYNGIIHFDPINETKKHILQSDWKYVALVLLDEDISKYYSWFLYKRYNIKLNKVLRGSHISFINDSYNDISKGLGIDNKEIINEKWNELKLKYDNTNIDIYLDLDVRSNSKHWWMNIPEIHRTELYNIRKEIRLGRPFFGLHISLGYCNEENIKQSEYILNLINKFGNEYN
jgi:hypothetical protein